MGLTVSSLADSGAGTLRAAILAADMGSSKDRFTIGFAVKGTIDLQSPLPDLNNSIAMQGPGAANLTVERAAGASFSSAIVTVDAGRIASLTGLTIANGNAGGVENDGTLTVANCAVVNNSAFFGAGINNHLGTLTVRGSTLIGNSATYGGGIWNFATLTVASSTLSSNSATDGGAIFNRADGFDRSSVTVRDSVLTGNSATEGGGIYNGFSGALTVHGGTLTGNTAGDSGGGLYNLDKATVQQSALSTNTAGSAGGGIFNGASGTLAVKDSTMVSNVASLGADLYNLGARTLDDSTVGVIGP